MAKPEPAKPAPTEVVLVADPHAERTAWRLYFAIGMGRSNIYSDAQVRAISFADEMLTYEKQRFGSFKT